MFTFDYNMSRLDLDFIDGDFFSSHIYRNSIGVFLAVFQIISVVSIILLCMTILIPQISIKFATIALFINRKWGTALHSTFFIWLGIATFCFFMIGVTYLLANKENK